jgi:hypothetical protein
MKPTGTLLTVLLLAPLAALHAAAADLDVVARRKGANWYIASMSGLHAASYQFPLNFLIPGQSYRASIYSDTPGGRKAVHSQQQVTSQTVIPIAMEPNGGHLMVIEGVTP